MNSNLKRGGKKTNKKKRPAEQRCLTDFCKTLKKRNMYNPRQNKKYLRKN